MSRSKDFDSPTAGMSISARIDLVCDEFEEIWNRSIAGDADRPKIEDYLERGPAARRDKLFRELLEIEIEIRLGQKESFDASDYLKRFPEQEEAIRAIAGEMIKTRRLGDYELLEQIGRGGMGEVFRARQVLLNQTVAIKILPGRYLDSPDAAARFKREMLSIGGLDHPNIVRAFNAGESEGTLYLVMEYVEGRNFDELVRRSGPLSLGAAAEIIRQSALGLQHAWENQLVHRDVKPANLMVSTSGVVKLLDLGLARLRADYQTRQLTDSHCTMGTIDYMAPEQWDDPSAVDIRADIYSLGCTFFFLLTGYPPFGNQQTETLLSKMRAHLEVPIPQITEIRPECPDSVNKVMARMTAKHADERFGTPNELVDAIGELASSEELREYSKTNISTPGSDSDSSVSMNRADMDTIPRRLAAARVSQASRLQQFVQRRKTLVTLVSAFALLVGTFFAIFFWPRDKTIPGATTTYANPLKPDKRTSMAASLSSLPGLSGSWWFEETPWYIPAVRGPLASQVAADRSLLTEKQLQSLSEKSRSHDIISFLKTIREATRVTSNSLTTPELDLAGRLASTNPEMHTDESLDKAISRGEQRIVEPIDSPEMYHLRAVLRHHLGKNEDADKDYTAAAELYRKRSPVGSELFALCSSDHGRLYLDMKDYNGAAYKFGQAIRTSKDPLFQFYCHCLAADTQRKWGVPTDAQLELDAAGELSNRIPPNHPLHAFAMERQAWLDMDQWRFGKAKESFSTTALSRSKMSDPQSLRWEILDSQGRAMADHFLGNQPDAIVAYGAIRQKIDIMLKQKSTSIKQRSELLRRRPNLYERLGDCYLFGNHINGQEAIAALDLAIQSAKDAKFREKPTLWPHLNRMRYKKCLAAAIDNDLDRANTLFQEAQDLEKKEMPLIESKMPDSELTEGQKGLFDVERSAAEALAGIHGKDLKEQKKHLGDLYNLFLGCRTDSRDKMETFFLVGKLTFDHSQSTPGLQLSQDQMVEMAERMLVEAQKLTSGDPGAMEYVRPYLNQVHAILQHSNRSTPNGRLQKVLDKYNALLGPAPVGVG